MERNFFLTTPHLGFSYWEEDDIALVRGLWDHPEVRRYTTAAAYLSPEQLSALLQTEMQLQSQFGIQYWPFFLRQSQQYLGVCGLHPYDLKQQICELGFVLTPLAWKAGIILEAIQAIIQYAFDFYEMKVLIAGHHPEDQRSQRVLKKSGFRYTHDAFSEETGLFHPSYQLFAPAN